MFFDISSLLGRGRGRRIPVRRRLSLFGCRDGSAGNVCGSTAKMKKSVVPSEVVDEDRSKRTFYASMDFSRPVHHLLVSLQAVAARVSLAANIAFWFR